MEAVGVVTERVNEQNDLTLLEHPTLNNKQ
jgi:hypothetical protein